MKFSYLSALLLATGLCIGSNGVSAAACDNPPRLRFSLVPQGDTRKDAVAFQPLLAALESELGKPVEVISPSSYGFVVEGLLAASIDLAFMGPASYATAKNSDPDIQAFASYSTRTGAFQDEGAFYRSLLVVRSDSQYRGKGSLKGARLALVDPASTSGAVLPRHFYSQVIKAPFEKFFGSIVYTGGHDKSAKAVASGQVDMAFVASNHLSDLIRDGKATREDYTVLWQSEPIPLDPFVYRGRLCAPIKETIKRVFLATNNEKYRALLDNLHADRFFPISDDSYKTIRELLRAAP